MYALKVKRKDAQKKIIELKDRGEFDVSKKVLREGDFVFIPIKIKIKGSIMKTLEASGRKQSLKEKYGIASFDLVGNIAIILIPDKLVNKKFEIGKHLLDFYPRVKAVYYKSGKVQGKFRIPELELIAGQGSETIHIENGIKIKLDVTKAYFSPRQSTERTNVVKYGKKQDKVAVFFAGVGPLAIYFSKLTQASEIYAIELNPDACKYINENAKLNNCKNIKVLCGDVKTEYKKIPKCNLVIMPLPKSSLGFLECAYETLLQDGRVIIYSSSTEEELQEKLDIIQRAGFEITKVRKELEIAPYESRYVIHGRKK